METTAQEANKMNTNVSTIEVIYNTPVKDVQVGDRIHQHGGGERTVIEARYVDGGECADSVLLVTVSDTDDKAVQDWYPVKAPTEWSWTVWYKVPVIRTEWTV
tara:strand:+ start:1345 stop:1653 length:309 start_codon:yes stop_codon:yes gene_type:complete